MAPRKSKLTSKNIVIIAAIIAATGGILAAIIGIFPHLFKSSAPEFYLNAASYHPDSTLIVQAGNRTARKNQPLILEIDGFLFPTQARSFKRDGQIQWQVNLKSVHLPDTVRGDGIHFVRFGFSGSVMSQPQKIVFDTQAPQTMVSYLSESPTEKRISGQVIDASPVENQNISVEIAFKHQEKLYTTQLPVKSYRDALGRSMMEFEYHVQNIPQVSSDDPSYQQPFFCLKVRDEAGNEWFQESTYNSFMAEGMQRFGNRNTQIIMTRMLDEETPPAKVKITSPPKTFTRKVAAGPPVITLQVLVRTPYYVQLSWNRLPEPLRGETEEYVMFRYNDAIGSSFDTTYTDRAIATDSTYQYQVLARGRGDTYFPSNIVDAGPESEPAPEKPEQPVAGGLSVNQVQAMLKRRGFYDINWNKSGTGVENDYQLEKRNGDQVVLDRATGLMWQQSGSKDYMSFEAAKSWINALNQKGYAGYRNWRLPTLEEAMTLMEPERRSGDLYIQQIFDQKQSWIWTSDLVAGGSGRVWVVFFYGGYCYGYGYVYYDDNYVRAVRSGQSSP